MPGVTKTLPAVVFPYTTLRNISTPQDVEQNRKVYSGITHFTSILDLPKNENVREYLMEAEGRRRRHLTQVHRAMMETLDIAPEDFSILNGGIVIVARDAEVDQNAGTLTLVDPSIINGSQTQGVLNDLLKRYKDNGEEEILPQVNVKYEIIITDNEELIAQTSIARNFQNEVLPVSIVGRLGLLDELEERLKAAEPDLKLRKSETDWARKLNDEESFVYTEKLIQVMTALIPPQLWSKKGDEGNPNKVYTYSQKTKCLRDFQKVAEDVKATREGGEMTEGRERALRLYEFYLDIAPQALGLYDRWKYGIGSELTGYNIRGWSRDESGVIEEAPDGFVFPILAALSAFAVKNENGWQIDPPPIFDEGELIRAAVETSYREIAKSNPNTMGKNKGCYSHLFQLTSTYRKVTDQAASAAG